MAMLRSMGDLALVIRTRLAVCVKIWSAEDPLENYGYACESRDAELLFLFPGSRPVSVRGDLRARAKDSRPRSDQKLGSNMHKTDSLPKESETSFVKFVREGGRVYARDKRKRRPCEFQKP